MSEQTFPSSIKSNKVDGSSATEMRNTHKIYFYATFLMTFVAFCTWWGKHQGSPLPIARLFNPTQPHFLCRRLTVCVKTKTRAN